MDAQLVGASGLGLELKPGDGSASPCPASLDAPQRQRLLAFRIDLHPPADLIIKAAERQIDFRQEYRSRIIGWYDGYFHIALIYAMGAAAFYVLLPQLAHVGDSFKAMGSANWG